MFSWIAQNLATILICAVLIAVVLLILRKMVKDNRAGKSGCGCGCGSCPMSGSCHQAPETKEH